jgi:hypothetical protein
VPVQHAPLLQIAPARPSVKAIDVNREPRLAGHNGTTATRPSDRRAAAHIKTIITLNTLPKTHYTSARLAAFPACGRARSMRPDSALGNQLPT